MQDITGNEIKVTVVRPENVQLLQAIHDAKYLTESKADASKYADTREQCMYCNQLTDDKYDFNGYNEAHFFPVCSSTECQQYASESVKRRFM